MDAEQLLAEALRLLDEARAALAGQLIQSLDHDVNPDAEAAWSEKIPPAAFSEEVDAAESASCSTPECVASVRSRHAAGLVAPFSIQVYRVEPRRILIVAVAHGRRRPGYWKSRDRCSARYSLESRQGSARRAPAGGDQPRQPDGRT